jgi:3'-5' exoribonuclease
MIDNLGGKLGSFDRIEKALSDGESWSGFDRALSGSAFFGSRRPAAEAREAEAA